MNLTSIPGSIQQILTEDFVVYTQGDTLNASTDAFIEFKIILNKSNKLFRKAKFIELNFIDGREFIFKNQFKKTTSSNSFSRLNENKTSYLSIQNQEEFLLKDISSVKDVYTSYQSNFNFDENFNFFIDFDENNYDQESKIYEVLLDLNKTKSILNKSFPIGFFPNPLNKINISILDKDKNIIDQSGFKNINLTLGSLISKINTADRVKFSKFYLDTFKDSIRLNYYDDAIQVTYNGRALDKLNIDSLDFSVTYFSSTDSSATISRNIKTNSSSVIFNYLTAGFTNFTNKIMLDYLNNLEKFKFSIGVKLLKLDRSLESNVLVSIAETLELDVANNNLNALSRTRTSRSFSNNNSNSSKNLERNQRQIESRIERDKNTLLERSNKRKSESSNLSYSDSNYEIETQRFELNRESNFINTVRDIAGNNIVNRCIGSQGSPKVTNSYEIEENKIKLIYDFSQVSSNFYDKIKIKSFIIDSLDVEYFYNNKNFSVESKVFYKGQVLKELLDSNKNLVVYKRLTSNPVNTSIIFEIVDFNNDRRVDFDEIREVIEEVNYNNIINQTNVIFKNNLNFSNIFLNTTISPSENQNNLFSYGRIALTNIEYFQDFAYNYGYINEDNTPNVVEFLNNCVLQIENKNIIEYDAENSFNLHSKFIFLRNVFNFQDVTSDSVYSNVNTQNQFLNGDDRNFIRELNDTNLVDFLTSESSLSNASKNLTKFNTLNIKNFLSLKVLPIPKIIFENLRSGIEIDRNYLNTSLIDYNRLESTEYAERLDKELVKYFFNNNSSLNYNKFNRFVQVLYSDDIENNISADSFVEMFQELSNANIEPRSFFVLETFYNKGEIIRSLNLGNDNFSFLEENILETINNRKPKSDHFNLQLEDNVINVYQNHLPFEYVISDYRFENEVFLFKKLKIEKNLSKKVKFNLTNLKNIFSEINFENAIFDLKSNATFHFLTTTESGFINLSQIDNEKYSIVDLEGKNFLSYNENYISNYPSKFVYYNLDQECTLSNNNNELVLIADFDFSNMSSLDYNVFKEFFDFCTLNGIDYLKKIILRSTVHFSFYYENERYDVKLFNNSEIPRKNLLNENIKINSIENIEKQIVNFV